MEESRWNELWKRCSGSIYQSWGWAQLNMIKGREPIFITVGEGNKLKAGILCFKQKVKTPLGTKIILSAEGTPLSIDGENMIEVLRKFREESRNYFSGNISPTFFDYDGDAFSKAGFRRLDNHTVQIPLDMNIDQLFSKLEKKSARWGVKKAEKEGVKIEKEHLKKDISEFYELYKKTSEQQFSPEPFTFFENIIMLERQKLAKLLIAKHGGRLIGGALLLLDSRYGIVSLTSISEEGMKLQAMNLLYWEMIKYCKENRKKLIDLGGYAEGAREGSKMYNINKFKENFGGIRTIQPLYTTSRKYSIFFGAIKRFGFLKSFYRKEK